MGKQKYLDVAQRLSDRIRQGDYNLQALPSERRLAAEMSVSPMTLRKALQKLQEDGLLARRFGARHRVHPPARQTDLPLALLVPAFETPEARFWQIAITRAAGLSATPPRMVYYAHWDDPVIPATLRGFSGVFFLPLGGTPPAAVLRELTAPGRAVAVLSHDWTASGLLSLRQFPRRSVRLVLDHLYDLGCRRIVCLNTQPEDQVVLERLSEWRDWATRRKLTGTLLHQPVIPFENPLRAAYDVVLAYLNAHGSQTDAVFCVTEPAALATLRALTDCGLRAGHDIALCAVQGDLAPYTTPSFTALDYPQTAPLLDDVLRWMRSDPRPRWAGSLLREPARLSLLVRESTANWSPPV